MAVTPECLAQRIEETGNSSAVSDQYIFHTEDEHQETFQQHKQIIIEQTKKFLAEGPQLSMVPDTHITEAEKRAIKAYIRRLAIKAQLELEEREGIDVMHENFQEIRNGCLFTMAQIKSKYPEIEEKINGETIESARLDFVGTLQKIPLEMIQQYENVRNEYSGLINETHKGALTAEKSDNIIEKQSL
jgi:hypothetical protein